MSVIAVIAGHGDLAEQSLSYLHNKDPDSLLVIGLKGHSNRYIVNKFKHEWVRAGQLRKFIDILKLHNVDRLVMIGSIKRPSLLDVNVDDLGAKFIKTFMATKKNGGDNALLTSIADFLKDYNVEVISIQSLVPEILAGRSLYSYTKPSEYDFENIKIGFKNCKIIGELDIGQGLVIEHGIVFAVEGVEGTDSMLKRFSKLSRSRAGIFIKVKKPNQDTRLDIPTVGDKTVKIAKKSGIKGIVIEADNTFLLNKEKMIALANKYGIFLIAINEADLKLGYNEFIKAFE